MDIKYLLGRIAFIRTVVSKNPVAADGLLKDLHREVSTFKSNEKPELIQTEIPESQYTRIKGTIHGPKTDPE